MKLSRFFDDLLVVYLAEIEDLKADSEGKNVLKTRLREKAEQLPLLLPMLSSNPEMLVPAFHQGFKFLNPLNLETLATKEESRLPTWKSLNSAVQLEPWAEKLSKIVLQDVSGDRFLVIAATLEYLLRAEATRSNAPTQVEPDDSVDNEEEQADADHRYDDDDDEAYDLGEAGADWLAEQGFDRKE